MTLTGLTGPRHTVRERTYKGEFKLGNQRDCYPLTVTDHASRYLLLCEVMESNQEQFAFTALERLFKELSLPQAIRSGNGVPFASRSGGCA
jgi:transposase InsO family protein